MNTLMHWLRLITACAFALAIGTAHAYNLDPWPPANRLVMNPDLPTTTYEFIRGPASWNQLAQWAMSSWNQVGIGRGPDYEFFRVRATIVTGNPCAQDGVSEMRFASAICGMGFGTALAVTYRRSGFAPAMEADIIFNTAVSFNAYSGPQIVGDDGDWLYDFTRVAIHELGHAAGLLHPDEAGQSVVAIMNSRASDVDSLQQDDINGAHAILWGSGSPPPPPCVATIAPTSNPIPGSGGAGTISVSVAAGCGWTAVSGVSWISIVAGSSGNGGGMVTYIVAANGTGAARTGTIAVAGQAFTVTQSGATPPPRCEGTIAPTSNPIPGSGGAGTITVSVPAGCGWTAASGATWISIVAGSSGNGEGMVTYMVAANPTAAARTGTITVASQSFAVTQDAGTMPPFCGATIAPASNPMPGNGGAGTITVSVAAGCGWTAASGASWISIVAGGSGNGGGMVVYTVAANTTAAARTGTIAVAGQTFTVTQAASSGGPVNGTIMASPNPCTLSGATCSTTLTWTTTGVSSASVYVRAGGGSPILLATGTSGTATAPWITADGATFQLHGGPSFADVLLASVTVRGVSTGSITATPCAYEKPGPLCATTVNWSTAGASNPSVHLRANGGAPVYIAGGATGAAYVPWIHGPNYVFELHDGPTASSSVLATVMVAAPPAAFYGTVLHSLNPLSVDATGKSGGGPINAVVEFVNACPYPADIYWIDFAGNRVPYSTVGSAQHYGVNTGVTHLWLAVVAGTGSTVQGTGALIGAYQASTNTGGNALMHDVAVLCDPAGP